MGSEKMFVSDEFHEPAECNWAMSNFLFCFNQAVHRTHSYVAVVKYDGI